MCTLFLSSSRYILDIKRGLSSSTELEYRFLEEQISDIDSAHNQVTNSIRWR